MKFIRTLLVAGGIALAAAGCEIKVQETPGDFGYTCIRYQSGAIEAKKGNKAARGKKGREWMNLRYKNMRLGEALDMLDMCRHRLDYQSERMRQPYRQHRRMRHHRRRHRR